MCLFWVYSAPFPSQTLLSARRMTWSSLPWAVAHAQVLWPGSSALFIWGRSFFSCCTSWLRHHVSRKAFPRPGGPAQALLLSSGGTVSRPHHSRFTSHCICSFSHTLPTDHMFAWGRSSFLIVSCFLVCLLLVCPACNGCSTYVFRISGLRACLLTPSWLLHLPQENGSTSEVAHLLSAPEPAGSWSHGNFLPPGGAEKVQR